MNSARLSIATKAIAITVDIASAMPSACMHVPLQPTGQAQARIQPLLAGEYIRPANSHEMVDARQMCSLRGAPHRQKSCAAAYFATRMSAEVPVYISEFPIFISEDVRA